jgi:cytochrome c553
MNRFEIPILALAASLVFAWAPAAQSEGDATRGNTLYHTTYKCTECHTSTPNQVTVVSIVGSTVDGLLNAISTITR